MDLLNKTKEALIYELQELWQENTCLKELYDKELTLHNYSDYAIRETNIKLTLAMEGGNMAWWEMDVPTGNVSFASRKVEMLGYPPENFKHYKDFTALVHPSDFNRIMNAMKGHFDGTYDKYEAEYRILAKSGEYIWFYDYGSVVKRDANGSPLICTGFVFNISERKKAELNLLKTTKALESLSDAVAIADSQGHHFYQNKALSNLFGYETAEEVESAGGGMARIKDPAIAKEMFGNILNGLSWTGELEMITKSGQVFPAYERADAIKDEEGNIIGVIGIISDITRRRQAEEKLLKSEHMLQTVLDNFPGVVFWKDRQSNYLGCNQLFATGAGLKSPAEIVGKTDIEMPWAATEAINYLKDDIAVMESGKGRMHIIETQHTIEGQVIWLDTSKFPLLDSLGQIIGIVGVSHDISILKMAEQELIIANKELAFQNEEKEKRAIELLTAIDKAQASDRLKTAFMNNISHEIRTPLNGILGVVPIIIQDDVSNIDKEELMEILMLSSNRLMKTIDNTIDLSLLITNNMEVHSKPVNISLILTNVIESFHESYMRKNLGIIMQFPENADKLLLNTDGKILQKAVYELVDNSVKFTKKGSITIGFELVNNHTEIFVEDTGKGIGNDFQDKVFDRFMQEDVSVTREEDGSGLGLSIAKGMIQLLGGKIRLESTKHKGTSVFLTIPNITSTALS